MIWILILFVIFVLLHAVACDVFVDVDGTLVSNELDELFVSRGLRWYEKQEIDDLAKRHWLLVLLLVVRAMGFRLVLWTNRGEMNIAATKRNLGMWWYMFSDHQFHGGRKVKPSHGITIDNTPRHATVCVSTYKGKGIILCHSLTHHSSLPRTGCLFGVEWGGVNQETARTAMYKAFELFASALIQMMGYVNLTFLYPWQEGEIETEGTTTISRLIHRGWVFYVHVFIPTATYHTEWQVQIINEQGWHLAKSWMSDSQLSAHILESRYDYYHLKDDEGYNITRQMGSQACTRTYVTMRQLVACACKHNVLEHTVGGADNSHYCQLMCCQYTPGEGEHELEDFDF